VSPKKIVLTFLILLFAFVFWLRWDTRTEYEVLYLDVASGVWISAPSEVTKFEMYLDGGSYGGSLIDSNNQEVDFWFDGGFRAEKFSGPKYPRLLYLGAQKSGKDSAVPIPVGSIGETEMISLLTNWVDKEISPTDQDRIYDIFFDYSIRAEERKRMLPDLSESQKRALSVLKVLRFLNGQRQDSGY